MNLQNTGLGWKQKGLCSEHDEPDIWFMLPKDTRKLNKTPTEGTPSFSKRQMAFPWNRAKSICFSCPVLQKCRDYSIDNEERYGIWGGLDPKQRRAILRAQEENSRLSA